MPCRKAVKFSVEKTAILYFIVSLSPKEIEIHSKPGEGCADTLTSSIMLPGLHELSLKILWLSGFHTCSTKTESQFSSPTLSCQC